MGARLHDLCMPNLVWTVGVKTDWGDGWGLASAEVAAWLIAVRLWILGVRVCSRAGEAFCLWNLCPPGGLWSKWSFDSFGWCLSYMFISCGGWVLLHNNETLSCISVYTDVV